MDWIKYLWAALGGGVFTVAALGALGALFKDVFTAWMTRRVSLSLDKKADRYKHELARDMEHYKDELNRRQSVDRVKAEIRKSVAERLLDARLTALHEINAQLSSFPSWLVAGMARNFQRMERIEELRTRLDAFVPAIQSNALYFDIQFVSDYHVLHRALINYSMEWTSETVRPLSHPDAIAISTVTAMLKQRIDHMLKALPSELSALIVSDEV
ncbi:hypothetical protein AWB74_04482 [Caballeronia arvi]|uniref:Uncharacterized protein n=1 Tax=Caballeronia arvi TaxID=1777135 RepID=A0A158JY46_9BURK|nr:hypothetical protein [Caballeronia arvi]SAL73403.1 hypothetical protein AWB74_04482 [Caballeronia arvi]